MAYLVDKETVRGLILIPASSAPMSVACTFMTECLLVQCDVYDFEDGLNEVRLVSVSTLFVAAIIILLGEC